MSNTAEARIAQLEKQLKNYKKVLNGWGARAEEWKKERAKYQKQIIELKALINEVRDHVDPTKKEIQLAVRQAKSWVARAVKILRRIF